MTLRTYVVAVLLLAAVGVSLLGCAGRATSEDRQAGAASAATRRAEASPLTVCSTCPLSGDGSVDPAEVGDPVVRLHRLSDSWAHMLDVVTVVAHVVGAELVLDDVCRERLAEMPVFICGEHRVRRSELREWLTAVLSLGDVALVPSEGESAGVRPRWTLVDSRAR